MAASRPSKVTRFGSLKDWLAWQESLHVTDIELGLERCRLVAERMGLARPSETVVTVAGTNGKGSSVAMLDAIWREAGYRVGTYTSPHLLHYNERIRIDGNAVSDEDICAAFELVESARGVTPLTYFEFGTLAALSLFNDANLDVAILEVGLGGRLDAVNIIEADAALIAAIDIDHVEFLGNDRETIALEKAGIMRAGKMAVCSDANPPTSLRRFANELPVRLEIIGDGFNYSDDGGSWSWRSDTSAKSGLPKPSLAGDYQLQNAAGVIMVTELLQSRLPLDDVDLDAGLRHTNLPGRFQRLGGDVETIVDVAHNAQAVAAFADTLSRLPPAPRTHVVLGMLKTKDHESVIRLLEPIADTWHLATVDALRGASSAELNDAFKRVLGNVVRANTYDSVASAYRNTLASARSGDRIVALGSFLVVGEVLACQ